MITCFLATTHAARYGARAGLGLTFIQYGAYWRVAQNLEVGPSGEEQQDLAFWNATVSVTSSNSTAFPDTITSQNDTNTTDVFYDAGFGGRDWLALFFMTFGKLLPGTPGGKSMITVPSHLYRFCSNHRTGWVLLFTSVVGFWRVKRWEMSIRASSQHHLSVNAPSQHHHLPTSAPSQHHLSPVTPNDIAREVQAQRNIEAIFGIGDDRELVTVLTQAEAEVRLTRHLRAAGLI